MFCLGPHVRVIPLVQSRHEKFEGKERDSDDERTNIDATGGSRTFRKGELSASLGKRGTYVGVTLNMAWL
jgi:hypothetical protein